MAAGPMPSAAAVTALEATSNVAVVPVAVDPLSSAGRPDAVPPPAPLPSSSSSDGKISSSAREGRAKQQAQQEKGNGRQGLEDSAASCGSSQRNGQIGPLEITAHPRRSPPASRKKETLSPSSTSQPLASSSSSPTNTPISPSSRPPRQPPSTTTFAHIRQLAARQDAATRSPSGAPAAITTSDASYGAEEEAARASKMMIMSMPRAPPPPPPLHHHYYHVSTPVASSYAQRRVEPASMTRPTPEPVASSSSSGPTPAITISRNAASSSSNSGSALRPRSYSSRGSPLTSRLLLEPPPAYSSSIPPGQKRLIAPDQEQLEPEHERHRRRRARPRDSDDDDDDDEDGDAASSSGSSGGVVHRDDRDSLRSDGSVGRSSGDDVEGTYRRDSRHATTSAAIDDKRAAAERQREEEEEERRRARLLCIGDRKRFSITVRQPLGPCLPPWGPDGKGRPRFIKVTERGEEISGYVDVGPKADGGVRLEVTLSGRLTSTQYYGGQPRITDSHKFVKRTVVVWPPANGSAQEGETIPTGSRHHWKIKLPLHADREDGTHASDSASENEDDDEDHAVAGSSSSAPMAIPKTRRFSFGRKSAAADAAAAAPTLSVSPPGGFSSPASAKPINVVGKRPTLSPTMLSTSERSPSFSFGSFLTRIASREDDAPTASNPGSSPGGRGKKALVRRESSKGRETATDVYRPKSKEALLPTLNIMIGDVQGEVEYELKFRLVRKGFRINEIVRAKIIYDPLPALHEGAEEVDQRNPGWTLVRLEGGEPLVPAAKSDHKAEMEGARGQGRGVEAEILLPQPLVLRLPPVPAQEYEEQPHFPFRIHFASTSPYPLWTFASRAGANWSISVVREIRVKAHTRECTRRMELRGIWSLDRDTGEQQQVEEILSPDGQVRDGVNVHLSTSPTTQQQSAGSYFDGADQGLTPYAMVDVAEQDVGDDAIFFEDDEEEQEGANGASAMAVPASTHASALAARLLATSESSPLAPSDVVRLREALETATPPPEFAIAEDNPNQSMPPPLPSVTLLPVDGPIVPGDMLQSPPATSTPLDPAKCSQVEHIYVQGMYKLSRSAYKTILTQFRTKDMSIRYFLEVTIEPKSGAIKEGFGKLKGRVELSVFKGLRE